MRLALAVWMLGLVACAPSLPDAFVRSRAAAERAYVNGRYDEAAQHWNEAAKAAESNRERHEARYRAAASLARAGRREEAIAALEWIERETPNSPRAARAAYDRADLEIASGRREKGHRLMADVVRRHPRSGLATSALRRVLIDAEQQGGLGAARSVLDRFIADLDRSALSELLHYSYARILERQELLQAALARYLYIAKRYPYPQGDYWDDALYNASLIEERLGRPKKAVAHLRRMLQEREPSHIQGSYERPRFSEAQYRIAELYRDRLGDPAQARREFRKVWAGHKTSLLRDDARWHEARLAHQAGDERDACRAVESIAKEIPTSRYVPCARRLCPEARVPKSEGPCRRYIARELEGSSE